VKLLFLIATLFSVGCQSTSGQSFSHKYKNTTESSSFNKLQFSKANFQLTAKDEPVFEPPIWAIQSEKPSKSHICVYLNPNGKVVYVENINSTSQAFFNRVKSHFSSLAYSFPPGVEAENVFFTTSIQVSSAN
jgi:hypothetical protein